MTFIPAQKPKRKPRQKRRVGKSGLPEKDLQAMAEGLCYLKHIRYFRLPDGLMGFLASKAPPSIRYYVTHYFAGLPDLLLFKRLPDGRNEVLFLEIKTDVGKLSPAQLRWHEGLNVTVTHGWEETRKAIEQFATNGRTE